MVDRVLPFVSVIVPVLNGERTIRKCLESLLRADYPPERREILVVDNGSKDRTAQIVASYPVALLREAQRGPAAARNRGIEASREQLLAFTDADCIVTNRWLRELALGFEDDDVGVVLGEVTAYPPETAAERYVAMRRPLRYAWSLANSAPWFGMASVAIRRQVFDRIGLFDVRFVGGCEDIDFSWRFFHAGDFRLVTRPKALAFHRHRTSARGLFGQYRGYGHGQALLVRKHPNNVAAPRRRQAYGDLLSSAWALGRAFVRWGWRGGHRELDYRYFELVRKLAEHIGFVDGTARGVFGRG